MEHFTTCQLTSTGTVATYEGEIIIKSLDNVSLRTHDKRATPHVAGLITVTTHRVIWMDRTRRSAIAAPLAALPRATPVENRSSAFVGSRTILRFGLGVRFEFASHTSGRDRDTFAQEVTNAVARAEWERIAEVKRREDARKAREGEFVRRRLGASGVQDKVAKRDADQGQVITSGFGSIDHLRSQAEDLMKIAGYFRTASATAARGAEENELLSMMAEMGIESPVTKDSAGGNVRVYREQLARQMADFLRKPVLNVGGIMTLSDAYCLVMRNRASTELVSPEDFRIACGYFARLGLAIEVVTLESGVLALKLDASRDSSGALALKKLAEEKSSLTPIDIVRIRHVPIQRATSMLEDAETAGFLARDSTTDGLRFFPNLFDSFASPPAQPISQT